MWADKREWGGGVVESVFTVNKSLLASWNRTDHFLLLSVFLHRGYSCVIKKKKKKYLLLFIFNKYRRMLGLTWRNHSGFSWSRWPFTQTGSNSQTITVQSAICLGDVCCTKTQVYVGVSSLTGYLKVLTGFNMSLCYIYYRSKVWCLLEMSLFFKPWFFQWR